jgi:hypothetical protein
VSLASVTIDFDHKKVWERKEAIQAQELKWTQMSLSLVTICFGVIPDLGEDLISLECLELNVIALWERIYLISRCSAGTPDSPVWHRTVWWIIAEQPPIFPKVASSASSSLVHRTLSGGTPDSPMRQTRVPLGCLLLSLFEPFLGLFIGLLWTFGTCKTYRLEQTS